MNNVVHSDKPSSERNVLRDSVPCVDENQDMMKPVKEDESLFPEDDEDRVSEFNNLRHGKQPHPILSNFFDRCIADTSMKRV